MTKKYSNQAPFVILNQYKTYIKRNKKNLKLCNTIETQILNSICTTKEVVVFINLFNEIIRDTHHQFLNLPVYLRPYYSEFFANKMLKKFNNKFKNFERSEFIVNIETLLKCFLKNTVTVDWRNVMRNYRKLFGFGNEFVDITDIYTLDKIKNNKI